MYATVSTGQIKPGQLAAFTQLWAEVIEPAFNQIPGLIDLYVLVNTPTQAILIVGIYTDQAEAQACLAGADYQQLFLQMAHLVRFEKAAINEYIVISQ